MLRARSISGAALFKLTMIRDDVFHLSLSLGDEIVPEIQGRPLRPSAISSVRFPSSAAHRRSFPGEK